MSRARVPAFQFYPKDYLSDGKQAAMSLTETGAYIRLLCVCWLEGSIPDDPRRIARIVGATPAQMRAIWPAVRACFSPGDAGTLVHARLERERDKQADYSRRQRENGQRGGRPVKPKANPEETQPITQPLTQTEAKKSSPISDLRSPDPSVPYSSSGEVQASQSVSGGLAAAAARVGPPLIGRHESVRWHQAQEKHHVGHHPEICHWRDASVAVCMPLGQVTQLAEKLLGYDAERAVTEVIGWARRHRPTVSEVPANLWRYWDEQWDARSVGRRAGSGVPGLAETSQMLENARRKAAGGE